MNNSENLKKKLAWEENWQTQLGAWFAGERVVMHGENVLELMNCKSWMEMFLFAITGRLPDEKTARLMDEVLALTGCIPDPRLWNNRVACLTGITRSTPALAVGAATAISDAAIYGFPPTHGAYLLIQELWQLHQAGANLEHLLKTRLALRKNKNAGQPAKGKNRKIDCLPGYGRPVSMGDERVPPLIKVLEKYAVKNGTFVTFSFTIEKTLQDAGYKLKLNTGGLIAAIAMDQGLSPQEFLHYITPSFFPGLLASYQDALNHPSGSFFPIRCEQIEYNGHLKRQWRAID